VFIIRYNWNAAAHGFRIIKRFGDYPQNHVVCGK